MAFFGRLMEPDIVGPELGGLPVPLLRFLMTSVFRLNGRTTPWSLRNRPHALHSGCPSGFLRHSGVVDVKQLEQLVGAPLSAAGLLPPGLAGREGAADVRPDGGGELGAGCGLIENMLC